ncbi:hypothetical protein Tco_1025112 [Tanacetum coccineum]
MNHQTLRLPQIAYNSPQPSTQPLIEFPQMDSGLAVPVFNLGDDPIAYLNKGMDFLTVVASLRFPSTNNQLRTSSNLRNQAIIQDGRVTVQQVQGRQGLHYAGNSYKAKEAKECCMVKEKEMLAEAHEAGQILDEEQLAFLADLGIPDGQAVQTTIPNTAAFQTKDLDAYALTVMMSLMQRRFLWLIFSAMGLMFSQRYLILKLLIMISLFKIPNLYAQQDSMILSVIEQILEQMINHVNNWEKANQEKNNESLTAELERYKERVKTFKQRLNIDLSTREKMIDSQMDDMIKEKLALKQQIDSLEQNLSNQIKEKESLLQTFTVFKNESKEKESKYMDKEIDLEKKIKELDNIVYKVGQSAQTVHIVISSQHAASHVIDDEETLILEEVSRSKILAKQNDPMSKEKKVNTTPINYVELNRLSKDFGKRFVPQQELSDEQAFCLVNTSLKKFKYHLGQFDTVVKKKITPDAITEGEWGSEHTKAVFLKEIIPFLKTLKDIQTVFNQMEATVQQYVMICMINSTAVFDDVNLEMKISEFCVKCLDLDAELLNKQNAYNDLSKSCSQLEKHCISLELTMQTQEHIKSMRENTKEENVKQEMDEIGTINIKLEHIVAELFSKNECCLHKERGHLKKIYKDQFDSIKKTHALSKEHRDSLIVQLNSKSMENANLKGQIQEKGCSNLIKLDLNPLASRLFQNKDAHINYLKHTQEQADILRGIVVQAKSKQPLDNALDFACVTPMNKVKKVRFLEPLTSLRNIHKQAESSKTPDSNTPVLPSTGLKSSTSASRS